jgi:hypothetical protein
MKLISLLIMELLLPAVREALLVCQTQSEKLDMVNAKVSYFQKVLITVLPYIANTYFS